MTKEQKQELIGKYGRSDGDTGSAEVQVALLTERINELTEHLRTHGKDRHSLPRPADAGRLVSAACCVTWSAPTSGATGHSWAGSACAARPLPP